MLPHQLAQLLLGVREPALERQAVGRAEREPRLTRIERGGALERRVRIRDALQCEIGLCEIGMEPRVVRLQLDRLLDERRRMPCISALERDHAGQVQRIRMLGLQRKYLFVKCFRFLKTSSLMLPQALLDQLVDHLKFRKYPRGFPYGQGVNRRRQSCRSATNPVPCGCPGGVSIRLLVGDLCTPLATAYLR